MPQTLESFWQDVKVDISDVTIKEVSYYYYNRFTPGEAVRQILKDRPEKEAQDDEA